MATPTSNLCHHLSDCLAAKSRASETHGQSGVNVHLTVPAQSCELVGLFLLEELSQIPGLEAILYRDDGLGVTRATARQTEKLRQAIISVFKKHGLKITISAGLTKVNFLDVTLDLEKGICKLYSKP